MRGLVCGLMNALDGIGDTLPFMIPAFRAALTAASTVVVVELGVSPGFATASGNSAAIDALIGMSGYTNQNVRRVVISGLQRASANQNATATEALRQMGIQ